MRKLIPLLPYERPIAAGRYRFEQNGEPTGVVESWQLSLAQEGYRFLRVDLYAEPVRGNSYLFHLTLNPDGRPERLRFVHLRGRIEVDGNLQFSDGVVTATRLIRGERVEDELEMAEGFLFWFPAVSGLALLGTVDTGGLPVPALTLDKTQGFALWPTEVEVAKAPPQQTMVMGRQVTTQPHLIRWEEQWRRLFVDEFGWPLRMEREYLSAVETRYIRYQGERRENR